MFPRTQENRLTYNASICGQPYESFIDKRLKKQNKTCRFNILDLNKQRPELPLHTSQSGVLYYEQMRCTDCERILPRYSFENQAIDKEVRINNGFNIRCRDCNSRLLPVPEKNREGGWTTAHKSIGLCVSATFIVDGMASIFTGTVTQYLPARQRGKYVYPQLYHIVWDDGDECDYNEEELLQHRRTRLFRKNKN